MTNIRYAGLILESSRLGLIRWVDLTGQNSGRRGNIIAQRSAIRDMLLTSTRVEVIPIPTGSDLLIAAGKAESVTPGSIQRVP